MSSWITNKKFSFFEATRPYAVQAVTMAPVFPVKGLAFVVAVVVTSKGVQSHGALCSHFPYPARFTHAMHNKLGINLAIQYVHDVVSLHQSVAHKKKT